MIAGWWAVMQVWLFVIADIGKIICSKKMNNDCFPSLWGWTYTERYRSGHNGADSKSVCAKAHKGSNPFLSAIKETSFVYQDKRGFFLLSGQNTKRIIEKRALERSIGYSEARFLRSAEKEYRNCCCTNRISLLCKQLLNVFRRRDSNRIFAKNPVRVMI